MSAFADAFPCTIPIGHRRFVAGGEDELGNPVESWAAPVKVLVAGWEPPVSAEPLLAGHDRVVVDVKLYADWLFKPHPRDRVVLNGDVFEVIGYPQDPNNNPLFVPERVTVLLKRIEG